MGDKYIIELEEKPFHKDNGDFLYRVKGFNGLVFDMNGIQKLTPYTESYLEAIRKEAYEEGRKVGIKDGMCEAWETARTLWNTPNRKEIFGHTTFNTVLTTLTAQEAIEKIRQYEQKKGKIQVGDEVNAPFGEAIVVNIDFDAEKIWLVYANGHGGFEYFKNAPTKTGRHFPEIAEVLAKMKEA